MQAALATIPTLELLIKILKVIFTKYFIKKYSLKIRTHGTLKKCLVFY